VRVAVRVAVVLLSAAVLQRGLFAEVRILGVAVDVFLLLAVAAGIAVGSERGAVIGFFAGLTLDLLVQTPLGLSALVYCLAAYLTGRLYGTTVRSSRWLSAGLVVVATASAVLAYAIVGELFGLGSAVSSSLPVIVAVLCVANAALAPLAIRVVRWAVPDEDSLRPALRRAP
jgi:rod shape-determining protein MreD